MKKVLAALLLVVCALPAVAQAAQPAPVFQSLDPVTSGVALRLVPSYCAISGSYYDSTYDTTVSFTGGEGALWASASYNLPFLPVAFVGVDVGAGSATGLALGAKAGAVVGWRVFSVLELNAYAQLGVWYMPEFSVTEVVPAVGVDLSYRISPVLAAGLAVSALYSLAGYSEVSIGASVTYTLSFGAAPVAQPNEKRAAPLDTPAASPQPVAQSSGGLEIASSAITDIYPVFYKYYDDHPIGSVTLRNTTTSALSNIRVSVLVREYMSDPKEVKALDSLAAGQSASVDLFALFRKDILNNTEDTKVSAGVTVRWTENGKEASKDIVQTIKVLRQTALTWDDDRKAAAFVTPHDPAVMRFANNVAAAIKDKGNTTLEPRVRMAAAIHDALSLYGITYVTTPVPTLNSSSRTVDDIRFPLQTLQNRSGKCSDFSALYASLFEAVGIPTAFITIPGHIFMAIALTLSPDEARATFTHKDDLIITDTTAWLPIEITLRDGGFMKAWQLGAQEYREYLARKQAVLYPLSEAWGVYEAVGFSGAAADIKVPADEQIVRAMGADLDAFVKSEMGAQEVALTTAVSKAATQAAKSKALNSLAILHSRFGLYDQAAGELSQVIAREEYVPALVNLGNISYMRSDYEKAVEYYNRAAAKSPKNPVVLLSVARANHALENYSTARKAYADLKTVSPTLAQEYAYLDLRGEEATRAASAAQLTRKVEWAE